MLRFTDNHEWLKLDGDIATVGITEHAVEQLGDLVVVELPSEGAELVRGDNAAMVETLKEASNIYAPLDGEIIEVNQMIVDDPSVVNGDPLEGGWFFRLKLTNVVEMEGLMDEDAYTALVG